MSELLVLFLVLACPIAMWLMMRGGHGHVDHARGRSPHDPDAVRRVGTTMSTEELRARRDELDRLIVGREEQREREETGAGT